MFVYFENESSVINLIYSEKLILSYCGASLSAPWSENFGSQIFQNLIAFTDQKLAIQNILGNSGQQLYNEG